MSKTVQRKETDIVSRKKDSFRSRCQVENRLISREKDVWTEEISRNNRKEKKVTKGNRKRRRNSYIRSYSTNVTDKNHHSPCIYDNDQQAQKRGNNRKEKKVTKRNNRKEKKGKSDIKRTRKEKQRTNN
jgi:hypothetical protein